MAKNILLPNSDEMQEIIARLETTDPRAATAVKKLLDFSLICLELVDKINDVATEKKYDKIPQLLGAFAMFLYADENGGIDELLMQTGGVLQDAGMFTSEQLATLKEQIEQEEKEQAG